MRRLRSAERSQAVVVRLRGAVSASNVSVLEWVLDRGLDVSYSRTVYFYNTRMGDVPVCARARQMCYKLLNRGPHGGHLPIS